MGTEVLRPQDCLRPAPAPAPGPARFLRSAPRPAKSHRGRKRSEGKIGAAAARVATDGQAVYAGTAFWMSPAPSALPIPKFSKRREDDGGSPVPALAPAAGIDYMATRDLRRLLRID